MATPARARMEPPRSLSAQLGRFSAWFAFLGSPVIWATHFLVMYALVDIACYAGSDVYLYLPTIVAVPLVIASGVVSWRLWHEPEPDEHVAGRRVWTQRTFFGMAGILMSAVFLLAILFEGISPLLLSACEP